MSEETDRDGRTGGARGLLDPLEPALAGMPYTVLPDLSPDAGSAALKQLRLAMQREKRLDETARRAFRELGHLPARLAWDALCARALHPLEPDLARGVGKALAADRREDADDLLRRAVLESDAEPALHAFVVLLVNEVSAAVSRGTAPEPARLDLFVGMTAALMARRGWLRRFARFRCAKEGTTAFLDDSAIDEFVDRLRSVITGILRASSSDAPGADSASFALECERVAVEIAQQAFSRRAPELPVDRFGPRGLEGLGLGDAARTWIGTLASRYRGGMPLTALGQTGPGRSRIRPEEAACVLQWAYSTLGPVVCHLWHRRPRRAWRVLGQQKRRFGLPDFVDPWLGTGDARERRVARALDELRAEVLVEVLRQQLSRPEAEVSDVSFTIAEILQVADCVRSAHAVLEALEDALCGRLSALSSTPMHPDLERVMTLTLESLASLRARGLGERSALALATTLRARAVHRWNRIRSERDRRHHAHRPMSDMWLAVSLAPRNLDIVWNLGRLVWQVQRFETSVPVRTALLRKTLNAMDTCLEAAGPGRVTREIRDIRDDILAELSPEEAMRDRLRKLEEVVGDPTPTHDNDRTDRG